MESSSEHFHSVLRCGRIEPRPAKFIPEGKEPFSEEGKSRTAFCVKHQVIICWGPQECGYETGWHYGTESKTLISAEEIQRRILSGKAYPLN